MLGEDIELIANYLRPTSRLAETIPCADRCTPGCRRRVISHGPDDYVAVCPEGSATYPVAHEALIVHELDVPAFAEMLCKALGLSGHIEPTHGLHQTWLMGYYPAPSGLIHPVYLTIQRDPALMQTAATQLCVSNGAPFALLVPTASLLTDLIRQTLEIRQSVVLPLEAIMQWSPEGEIRTNVRLADVFASGPRGQPTLSESVQPAPGEGQILLERREMADGVHWFVDGLDRGCFCTRGKPIKGRILEILFSQIGNGFIPHQTFMHACGWTEKHYLAKGREANLIQKHLTDIRNFLGLKVLFRIDEGVCFDANIVKSKQRSR